MAIQWVPWRLAIWPSGYRLGNTKARAATRDPKERYAPFADKICEQGWFGRKTGKGYYIYDENQRPTGPNPAVMGFIEAERSENSHNDKNISESEIYPPLSGVNDQ